MDTDYISCRLQVSVGADTDRKVLPEPGQKIPESKLLTGLWISGRILLKVRSGLSKVRDNPEK